MPCVALKVAHAQTYPDFTIGCFENALVRIEVQTKYANCARNFNCSFIHTHIGTMEGVLGMPVYVWALMPGYFQKKIS